MDSSGQRPQGTAPGGTGERLRFVSYSRLRPSAHQPSAHETGRTGRPLAIAADRLICAYRDKSTAVAVRYGIRKVAKEDKIELEGEVVEALPNAMFKVKLDNGHEVLGHVAGKMRRFRIRILPGDRVRCELSPYDLDRARITYRHR